MGNNQSNDLEQVLENNPAEAELGKSEKEFTIKPSDPYPHKYYTGDISMASNTVPRNEKE
ncbi:hypothetical protein ACLHWY_14590 [Priestia aryabhattai]|uniref:hypothetical protein n=1 Tax=Priestia TaxID=2800373 RepID=UPI003983BBF7